MKKNTLLLVLLFIFAFSINTDAQRQVGWIAKFGAAGGFTPVWIMPDFNGLNEYVTGFGLEELPSSGMVGYGGSGYAYIMFIKNVRIGGGGFGGSVHREAVVNGYSREVVYNLGMGAFTAEYTLPFIRKVAVSVGAMIGGGDLEIEVYKNSGDFTFGEVWNEANGTTDNVSRKMTNTFFTIAPTLNIDIPVTRFIALRAGAGYMFTVGDQWEVANGKDLLNVPSDINGDSFFIQTGIFFGFFAF